MPSVLGLPSISGLPSILRNTLGLRSEPTIIDSPILRSEPSYVGSPSIISRYEPSYINSPSLLETDYIRSESIYKTAPSYIDSPTYIRSAPNTIISPSYINTPTILKSSSAYNYEPSFLRTEEAIINTPTIIQSAPLERSFVTSNIIADARSIIEPRIVPSEPITYSTIDGGEAKYVAVTRGSRHEAPLPGHTISRTSLNLAPPPTA